MVVPCMKILNLRPLLTMPTQMGIVPGCNEMQDHCACTPRGLCKEAIRYVPCPGSNVLKCLSNAWYREKQGVLSEYKVMETEVVVKGTRNVKSVQEKKGGW